MSALQDIALDLEAEAAEHRAAAPHPMPTATPAGTLARWRHWFAQLPVGGKITLFFTGNLAFALLAGLFVVVGYVELGQRAAHIRSTHDAALKAERLLVQLSEGQRHAEMLVADGDAARFRAAREALDRAAASAAALSGTEATSPVRSPPSTPVLPPAALRPPRSTPPALPCSKPRAASPRRSGRKPTPWPMTARR